VEWTAVLKQAIDYMEEHLLDDITVEAVAENVSVSNFYFQKGFKIMTGYTIGEYIRNRRLYMAALDVLKGNEKIIDIAYKYGYDTPESFSKAFNRFHGVSPIHLIGQSYKLKIFQPLIISISIKGGNVMDFTIDKMGAFKVVGMERTFQYDSAYEAIPKFWNEYCQKYMDKLCSLEGNCNIGKYGINIDENMQMKEFRYLIAGDYNGGDVPEGFDVVEIPAMTWAKFRCVGPMPSALQSVNTRIFKEWLPNNNQYDIAAGYNVEMYSMGDTKATDYVSEIWIPIKKK